MMTVVEAIENQSQYFREPVTVVAFGYLPGTADPAEIEHVAREFGRVMSWANARPALDALGAKTAAASVRVHTTGHIMDLWNGGDGWKVDRSYQRMGPHPQVYRGGAEAGF
jgi:hypothetical protein